MSDNSIHFIEQCLLGALIKDGLAWQDVCHVLNPDSFSVFLHRDIYHAMQALTKADLKIDVVTLENQMTAMGTLRSPENMAYIYQLASGPGEPSNITSYVSLIEKSVLLEMVKDISLKLSDIAINRKDAAKNEIIDLAEYQFSKLLTSPIRGAGFKKASDCIAKVLDEMEGSSLTLATGFLELDKILAGGMRPGEIVVVGALPGMGKSAFGLNIADYVAHTLNKTVGFFSLEMEETSLWYRLLSSSAHIPGPRLLTAPLNKLTEREWSALTGSIGRFSVDKLFIDDAGMMTPSQIRLKAKRLKRERADLSLLVIDYVGLLTADKEENSKAYEIANITRSIKILAKELNIPIILLSQLNRRIMERANKRPVLSDLRDSGSVEQDADIVIFISREERFDPETKNKGLANIYVEKNRRGETGEFQLIFNGAQSSFLNYKPY